MWSVFYVGKCKKTNCLAAIAIASATSWKNYETFISSIRYYYFNIITRGGFTIEFSEMRGPNKIFGPFCEINGQNILFGSLISENSIVKPPLVWRQCE